MSELFKPAGVHVVVDGQFGSTGKGVLAAWLALQAFKQDVRFCGVLSNAGPNSGHTFYHGDEKIVLKQLPTFAVASYLLGRIVPVFLTAGAVIDVEILRKEALMFPNISIFVHPNAVVITPEDKEAEHSGTIAAVAGTRSGTGHAIARKVARDPYAVFSSYYNSGVAEFPSNVFMGQFLLDPLKYPYFMEISQGFSLGINQGFYPKCTSRECTVSQGFADAGIPPRAIAKTYMSIRTFPIRVGNVDGHSSGDWYWDQHETSWEKLGVEAELTTVTQRVRRVATFSITQYVEASKANDPDFVFVNFMNYLPAEERQGFATELRNSVVHLGRSPELVFGSGPRSDDVSWHI